MSQDLKHGGALDFMRAQFPDAPEPWIDLSTGINPWPYSETDIPEVALKTLPTRASYQACKTAMANAIGASPESLVLAPGSELLIRLLPHLIQPKIVAILSPTYGDHEIVWRGRNVQVTPTLDPLAFADTVDAIIVCNPNNPDGRRFSPAALEAARKTLAQRGGWLIVDEAYADLTPELSLAHRCGAEGLIVLRSFGKFFGLAGLRLGAMIAPVPILEAASEFLGSWPVSGSALSIGTRAYRDLEWQANTRARLKAASERLESLLNEVRLSPVGGTHLFQYVKTNDAHQVWAHLARQGIYVRRFEHSDQHLRIGLPPTAVAEQRLHTALSLLA